MQEFFSKIFLCEFFPTLWCFHSNQKKFLNSYCTIYLEFLLGFGKPKKRVFGKIVLIHLPYLCFSFSQGFFFVILISIPLVFSTLELKSTISFYRIFVWEKKIVCGCFLDHQVVNPIFTWLCAFGLYPSSCEVILVSFVLIPQVVR